MRLHGSARSHAPPSDRARSIAEPAMALLQRCAGLEAQLLGLTIQREQPELERQKSALLKQVGR